MAKKTTSCRDAQNTEMTGAGNVTIAVNEDHQIDR